MYLTNNQPRAVMRYGFSEWDEWHEVLPGHRFLAMANYCGPDAPDWIPAGACKHRGKEVQQETTMRPGWWG